jgi:hypothetical protein
VSNITTTSRAVGGLTSQGRTYFFRVYALVDTTSSSASPTASATTSIDGPGYNNFYASRNGTVGNTGWANYWLPGQNFSDGPGNYYQAEGGASATCYGGATPEYAMNGRYNSGGGGPYYVGWTTQGTWHLISPYSPYQAIFEVSVRCSGPNAQSGAAYWGTRCVRYNGSGC